MCRAVCGGIASSAADMKLMRLSLAPRVSHASFYQASNFLYCRGHCFCVLLQKKRGEYRSEREREGGGRREGGREGGKEAVVDHLRIES